MYRLFPIFFLTLFVSIGAAAHPGPPDSLYYCWYAAPFNTCSVDDDVQPRPESIASTMHDPILRLKIRPHSVEGWAVVEFEGVNSRSLMVVTVNKQNGKKELIHIASAPLCSLNLKRLKPGNYVVRAALGEKRAECSIEVDSKGVLLSK